MSCWQSREESSIIIFKNNFTCGSRSRSQGVCPWTLQVTAEPEGSLCLTLTVSQSSCRKHGGVSEKMISVWTQAESTTHQWYNRKECSCVNVCKWHLLWEWMVFTCVSFLVLPLWVWIWICSETSDVVAPSLRDEAGSVVGGTSAETFITSLLVLSDILIAKSHKEELVKTENLRERPIHLENDFKIIKNSIYSHFPSTESLSFCYCDFSVVFAPTHFKIFIFFKTTWNFVAPRNCKINIKNKCYSNQIKFNFILKGSCSARSVPLIFSLFSFSFNIIILIIINNTYNYLLF